MTYETLAIVLAVAFAVVGVIVTVLTQRERIYRGRKATGGGRPQPDPVPQIPPLDPMVLCPKCSLLGYHSLDEIPPVSNPIRVFETPDGDTVEINAWGGGTPGHWRRQCCFCDHTWSVPLDSGAAS